MTSQSISQSRFLYPDSAPDSTKDANGTRYKKANVYDAVAGKISSGGFIPKNRVYASTRDTASSSTKAVPPENVLFKRKDAPIRYAESDIYFANERESTMGLPDSDLLKALHVYASNFYARAVPDGRKDFKSFDETALLAFGILMEEATREILGSSGDLALTEGQEIEQNAPSKPQWESGDDGRRAKKRRVETAEG